MKVDTCIVPQDKWSRFEESYENNVPIACDIAMQALDEIFKSKGLVFTELMLWRKYCGDVPSFQHLCFRYKEQGYLYYIGNVRYRRDKYCYYV